MSGSCFLTAHAGEEAGMPRVFKIALPEGARDRRGWHFPLFTDAETAFHRRWFDDFRARFRAALVVARFSGPLAQFDPTQKQEA